MTDIVSSHPADLPEALARAAQDFPNKAIHIFDGRGRNVERHTYSEFFELATDRAARFARLGVGRREPVVIALPTSWDWLISWWGVVLAGGWPVAASGAGAIAAAEAQYDKVDVIMSRLGARYVVSSEGFREGAAEHSFPWAANGILTTAQLADLPKEQGFRSPAQASEEVAFLQLTSGSTGSPRAVMISNRGAIHNAVASSIAIGASRGKPVHEFCESMVSWLPLYHDMGLIGSLLLPIATGLDVWLLRPPTFLARPDLWLKHLGAHGNSFVPSPNFGYQLCVERIKPQKMEGVDLSCWKAALTGAEMIRPETVDAFCSKFGPYGFDPKAFVPCYGLAEGTLAVTFDMRGEGVRTLPAPAGTDAGFELAEVVSNGAPIDSTEVEIRAPDGSAVAEGQIGEVCIKGPGVFLGYYQDEAATTDTLRDGWFSTGDLGFLADGELYLTGRIKDVLIVHGHNIMPDEIERIADGVTGGGGLARAAAFSISRGVEGEQAILVVESTQNDPEQLASMEQEIRSRVGRHLGLPLADVVFVRRGRIPRTSSGKMQRNEVRRKYLDETLERMCR